MAVNTTVPGNSMRTPSSSIALTASPAVNRLLSWPAVDLAAHHGSARSFHDSCISEMDFGDRFSQWTEWLDRLLARRFATSVVLVGSVAALIALAA